ncbi:MAG TPA: bifunctional glutamate N-acetyltransferase/amino-acid acetyltransferase ArgJ [Polyangiaceae bacterium]|nr:bifunctional glutamate N-acetyltransferase/amino-acid acetyltransferase ArgJ [Polyangiaceae bacterium]
MVSVPGFRFSAVAAGIRKDGRIDTALAVADRPATVAGVFTRNLVRAAPVVIASERVLSASAQAVLVNSGCANACTGAAGHAAAESSTAAVARALGIDANGVLPASTGVIGVVLPAARIIEASESLVAGLSADKSDDFARAIMTTDRWPKVASTTLTRGGSSATVLAIGKGAGMIHPDVGPPHATMLVFIFTDAQVSAEDLSAALVRATDDTFNSCTVDGDTSTNDSVFAFASGVSALRAGREELTAALFQVCDELARSMVKDGEGSEHVVEIAVRGLADKVAARNVARTVATSLLVKTAIYGRDANWGRLLAAAGRAGVPFDPNRAIVRIGDAEIVRNGVSTGAEAEARASQILRTPEFRIELVLGDGPGEARYLTSDIGHAYVDVNASYRS